MDDLKLCLYDLESFQTIWKVSGRSKKCPDHLENVAGLSKILQNHLLCAFVADLKIDANYVLYLESFCDKNLAIRKVFAFCDSVGALHWSRILRSWHQLWSFVGCNFCAISELVRPQPCTRVTGTLWLRLHNGRGDECHKSNFSHCKRLANAAEAV